MSVEAGTPLQEGTLTQTSTPPLQVMPAAFFGHGNPMNALEVNRYTVAWGAFG
jgi:4,5-DOPA dioxygenase extradiol